MNCIQKKKGKKIGGVGTLAYVLEKQKGIPLTNASRIRKRKERNRGH